MAIIIKQEDCFLTYNNLGASLALTIKKLISNLFPERQTLLYMARQVQQKEIYTITNKVML